MGITSSIAMRTETFVGSSFCVFASLAVLGFCVARRKALWFCSGFLT